METKRIKCPGCGVLLDVRNSQNETVKMITCPQCKSQLRVNFPQNNGETQYVGSFPSNGDDTVYMGRQQAAVSPGYLVYGAQSYPLQLGMNVVGRKASTSQATVQIATDDRYMSRQHLNIHVNKVTEEKVRVVVSNEHNKNATYVNGQLLDEGDQLVITDGSTIKMGNTTVTYHQK